MASRRRTVGKKMDFAAVAREIANTARENWFSSRIGSAELSEFCTKPGIALFSNLGDDCQAWRLLNHMRRLLRANEIGELGFAWDNDHNPWSFALITDSTDWPLVQSLWADARQTSFHEEVTELEARRMI